MELKRIPKNTDKEVHHGHKRNCQHKMSDNEAINTYTDREIEFRRCIKNCGFWVKKTTWFDTDKEYLAFVKQNIKENPNDKSNLLHIAVIGELINRGDL